MDARTNSEARLPSRPVAERFARASVETTAPVAAAPFKKPRLFKKPRYIPDSIPRSRHVAKDMLEFAGIPILMTTLRGHGHLHGDCMTVTGPTVTENLKPLKWKSHADV